MHAPNQHDREWIAALTGQFVRRAVDSTAQIDRTERAIATCAAPAGQIGWTADC
jgi:hypothetical protein